MCFKENHFQPDGAEKQHPVSPSSPNYPVRWVAPFLFCLLPICGKQTGSQNFHHASVIKQTIDILMPEKFRNVQARFKEPTCSVLYRSSSVGGKPRSAGLKPKAGVLKATRGRQGYL